MEEKKVGELIKTRREELNITQKKLAGLLGVTHSTVSRWESGYIKEIKRAQIYLLSKYLYIPIDTILGLSNVTSTLDIDVVKKRIQIETKLEGINDKNTLEVIENFINAYCSTKKGN